MRNPALVISLLCALSLNAMAADYQPPAQDLSAPVANTRISDQLSNLSLQQRIARLENIVQNQSQLLGQMSNLQQSVQQLRGQIDVLTNDNKSLREQQRKLYGDLDQRLRKAGAAATPATSTPVAPTSSSPTTRPTTQNVSEYEAYQQAYNLIVNRQFPQAISAMQAFLKQYPVGDYAANAAYWLGEVYLAQGQADQAQQQFNNVVKNYPDNRKIPDAMLKLAFINYDKGNSKQAISQLNAVQKRFPTTTAARLAAAKLQVIKASQAAN